MLREQTVRDGLQCCSAQRPGPTPGAEAGCGSPERCSFTRAAALTLGATPAFATGSAGGCQCDGELHACTAFEPLIGFPPHTFRSARNAIDSVYLRLGLHRRSELEYHSLPPTGPPSPPSHLHLAPSTSIDDSGLHGRWEYVEYEITALRIGLSS